MTPAPARTFNRCDCTIGASLIRAPFLPAVSSFLSGTLMNNLRIVPQLIICEQQYHYLFTKEMDSFDYDDLQNDVHEFLESSILARDSNFTTVPMFAKSVRVVDCFELSKQFADSIIDNHHRIEELGHEIVSIRANVRVTVDNRIVIVPKETIEYSCHIAFRDKDTGNTRFDVVNLYPIGFCLEFGVSMNGSRRDNPQLALTATFDQRVLPGQVEDSLAFFVQRVEPTLHLFLDEIPKIHSTLAEGAFIIDMDALKETFTSTIIRHYEQRLADPKTRDRQCVCLDVIFGYFSDGEKNGVTTARVRVIPEESKTPTLSVWEVNYERSEKAVITLMSTTTERHARPLPPPPELIQVNLMNQQPIILDEESANAMEMPPSLSDVAEPSVSE